MARRALLIAGVILVAGCFDELGDYEDGSSSTDGTVPDENSLRRSLDLASSVKGVREIRNGMVVEFPK